MSLLVPKKKRMLKQKNGRKASVFLRCFDMAMLQDLMFAVSYSLDQNVPTRTPN